MRKPVEINLSSSTFFTRHSLARTGGGGFGAQDARNRKVLFSERGLFCQSLFWHGRQIIFVQDGSEMFILCL